MVDLNLKTSETVLKRLKGLSSPAKRQKSLGCKNFHIELYTIYKTHMEVWKNRNVDTERIEKHT